MTGWIEKQKSAYFGNAIGVKDFRVQFRGGKAIWAWSAYVFLLLFLAASTYAGVTSMSDGNPSLIQEGLTGYLVMMTGVLQTVVLIIAPMLVGAAIVAEHERQSLELVMVGPVSPKYFLVGKLLSAYRQLLLILLLSLPMTAMAVVLGGATWRGVLETYALLSMQGLVAMAISVPLALTSKKTSITIIGTYAYLFLITVFGMIVIMPSAASVFMGGLTSVPPLTGLIPYSTSLAIGLSVNLFGFMVPTWLFNLLVTLLVTKVSILGGGAILSRYPSAELKGLRLWLLVIFAFVGLIVALVPATFAGMGPGAASPITTMSVALAVPMIVLAMTAVPVATFSFDSGRKFYADRVFSFQELLRGRPSGGLPFLLVVLALTTLAPLGYAYYIGLLGIQETLLFVAWGVAFTMFVWAAAWLASTWSRDIYTARRTGGWVVLALIIISVVVCTVIQTVLAAANVTYNVFNINPFISYAADETGLIVKTASLLAIAALCAAVGEKQRVKLAAFTGVH